jgi:hypothetical protein
MTENDATHDTILAEATATNNAIIVVVSKTNKTYERHWRKYIAWVKSQPELGTVSAPFLTRQNVDSYFARVVVNLVGNQNSTRTSVSALQWFANNREHVDKGFVVASPTVQNSIRTQQAKHRSSGGHSNRGTDPLKGLKDIFPERKKVEVMCHIYQSRQDWESAAINFTWGHNNGVRGHSNRKCVLADLHMSENFVPEKDGPLGRCLLLVFRKGPIHKDNHVMDQQTGCWRHRNYLLCSVFATAMSLIARLAKSNIHFKHENKRERAEWWDFPLIDWEEYSGKYYIHLHVLDTSRVFSTGLLLTMLPKKRLIPPMKYLELVA